MLYLLIGLLVACQGTVVEGETAVSPTEEPAPTPMPEPTSEPHAPFRIIAYVTPNIVLDTIPYDQLTHINYAFLLPNADGTFKRLVNSWKLDQIVRDAHEADVKVLISVGGWGWDAEFEAMAANTTTRAAFVENLSEVVAKHKLDGADVDWEYPKAGESADNYLALMEELREVMPDKLLTTAVVSHGANGDGVPFETFALFDFVNVMTYDGPDHGSMAQFNLGLDYWRERGLPPEKTVMGIPFYARPSEAHFRKIVDANPNAAQSDTTDWQGSTIHYNGIPTVQEKTRLAQEQAGGIMFWTLDYDALGDASLVKAINTAIE
ncbi:MAG: glycosyl hydrolase family 18 protein [Chloroflexota bacterium]